MNKIIYAFLFLVVYNFSGQALAQGPGWTEASEVVEIVTVIHGGINVRLSPELSGCTSQSGYGDKYASIYPTHAGLDLMQSNLLAAMMAGKKVKLYLGDSNCKATEMRIYR